MEGGGEGGLRLVLTDSFCLLQPVCHQPSPPLPEEVSPFPVCLL